MRIPTIAVLLSLFISVSTYKVLVYSNLFGHSHVKMLGAVADTITDAGHNVTVLMPVIDEREINRTGLKTTKNVIMVDADEKVVEIRGGFRDFMSNLWVMDNANPLAMISKIKDMSTLFSSQCRKVLSSKELMDKLRAEKFDLAIAEPFDLCAYELFEAINVRAHVSVLACARLDHVSAVIGQPTAPSYVPGTQSVYGDRMTMKERLLNAIQAFTGGFFFGYIGDVEDEVTRELFPNQRSWRDVLPESSFIFTNQIPLLDFPSPTFDKIIPIGGISVKSAKSSKLPEKWNKVLSLRKKNVLISFGSNAKSVQMPEPYKKSILEMAQSMPDTTFIWKYEDEKDTFSSHVKNIVLGSWLPQNELLADKRLNVFLTHGGLASTTELAMMGVPCVMVPLFADQGRNAQMLKRHGGALSLEKNKLGDSKLLRETIEEVLNNAKYKENAQKLAEVLTNQPTDPKEQLVKHVEFAARFGKLPSLDPYGRHQSFIQYFYIDIISIAVISFFLFLVISFKLFKFLCCRKKTTKTQEIKTKSD